MPSETSAPLHPHEVEFAVAVTSWGTTRMVNLRGELDLSTVAELDAALADTFAEDFETLVVDLSEASFVDSTGLRSLVTAQQRAHELGIHLVLVPAPPTVQKVFEISGLDQMLRFVPAAEAVAVSDDSGGRG